jgi:uncharacterized protein (DUF58 family)
VRIPKTAIRTAWRADWLVEFSVALVALAFLAREIILAVIGAGILFVLASLGFLFQRRLPILRRELHVAQRLSKTRVFLGDSIEGELTIRNGSRLAAQVIAVVPVVDKGLRFKLSSSSDQLLRPNTTSSSKFEITSLKTGRFQISGFTLTFADARGLFTREVNYEQGDWVEVYPGIRTKKPITPLRLYGGSPELFRKAPTGMDYAGIRQYAPGDEYHRVEWKATARLRTLMVKELHPETSTMLQILIDAGRTMHQESYAGTKLDEALTVAQLLLESTVDSGDRVGIWIYNETGIVKHAKPAFVQEQLAVLRGLGFVLRTQAESKGPGARIPRLPALWRETPDLLHSEGAIMFTRALRFRLGIGHPKTGVYRALTEAAKAASSFFIILTDLQTDNEALLKAVTTCREPSRIFIGQVGAAWRLGASLEQAYVEYQNNMRILRRTQQAGAIVLDLPPERLTEAITQHIARLAPR